MKKKSAKKNSFFFKRRLTQIAAFGFCNFRFSNFFSGKIYSGKWKAFCTPGLNCYSCPAANFSCPIGAVQATLTSPKFNFSFYALGIVLAVGVFFGRAVCAFFCPFGFFQELIFKIPTKKFRVPKIFKFFKYAIFLIFVLILPVSDKIFFGAGAPAFCKYICPAGTLEGGLPLVFLNDELQSSIGFLFFLKIAILVLVVFLCVFFERFFCKVFCPLGAIYSLLNKISFLHLKVEVSRCTNCSACEKSCPMDINPVNSFRNTECILCAKCIEKCPNGAIKFSFFKE